MINLSDKIKNTLHSPFYKPIKSASGSKARDNKNIFYFLKTYDFLKIKTNHYTEGLFIALEICSKYTTISSEMQSRDGNQN